jgi:predicted dehydrogenase
MNRGRLGMGLVGPGFIARRHIIAARRLGDVGIVGLAGSSRESAARKAPDFNVDCIFANYEQLVSAPELDVVDKTPRQATSDVPVDLFLYCLRSTSSAVSM